MNKNQNTAVLSKKSKLKNQDIEIYEIKQAKRQAKTLFNQLKEIHTQQNKKENFSISLMNCQELFAKQKGYSSWHHFHKTITNDHQTFKIKTDFLYQTKTLSQPPSPSFLFIGNEKGLYTWLHENAFKIPLLLSSKLSSTQNNNTDILMSVVKHHLIINDNFIYIDNADNMSTIGKIIDLSEKQGKTLKVVGFDDFIKSPKIKKNSVQINPLFNFSATGLTSLFVSLLDNHNSNSVWYNRAINLLSAIMHCLCEMRDRGEIKLTLDLIREYLILDNMRKLSLRRDFTKSSAEAVRAYLYSLPGYNSEKHKQINMVMDQHGYLQMQFTQIFGMLDESYGHVFSELKQNPILHSSKNTTTIIILPSQKDYSYQRLSNFISNLIKLEMDEILAPLQENNQKLLPTGIVLNESLLPDSWTWVLAVSKKFKIGITMHRLSEHMHEPQIRNIKSNSAVVFE